MNFNKTNKGLLQIAVMACVVLSSAVGQTLTSSPYTYFGIGDLQTRNFVQQRSMGGVSQGIAAPYSINLSNPAALAANNLAPVLETGINAHIQSYSNGVQSYDTANTYMSHFALSLPLKRRKMGLAFGFEPFSKIGFFVENQESNADLGNYKVSYQGSGGIREAFLGFAYNIISDSTTIFSVGAKGNFLFGNMDYTKRTITTSTSGAYNTRNSSTMYVSNFSAEFGAQFIKNFKANKLLIIGATYTPNYTFNVTEERLAYTYIGLDIVNNIKDSIFSITNNGTLKLPSNFGVGFSLDLNSQWKIAADFNQTNWEEFQLLDQVNSFKNRREFNVGAQYIPDSKAYNNLFKSSYYRFGGRYIQSNLFVNNTQLTEFSVSGGIGFPLAASESPSRINLGIELGQRGNVNNGLIRETYTNLMLGITFVPYRFDKWFVKRKID